MNAMKATFPKLMDWLEEKPEVRYAEIQCHPGFGTPGLQIKLYERDDKVTLSEPTEPKSVTVKGDLTDAQGTIMLALARWQAGLFDSVVAATRIAATDAKSDSGSHKRKDK